MSEIWHAIKSWPHRPEQCSDRAWSTVGRLSRAAYAALRGPVTQDDIREAMLGAYARELEG